MGREKKRARVAPGGRPVEVLEGFEHAGESMFTRLLGSSDFHTRERGVQVLASWLARSESIDTLSLDKVWKGILFCFWHSDKQPVQQELAQRLADIMLQVNRRVALQYFRTFLGMMMQNWGRIDRLRLDKFMMLVRVFYRTVFEYLAKHSWHEDATAGFLDATESHAFHEDDATAPIGLSLHVTDVFVSELCVVATAPVPQPALLQMVGLFIRRLQQTRQQALMNRIRDNVFMYIYNELKELACEEGSKAGKSRPALSMLGCSLVGRMLFDGGAQNSVRAVNRSVLYQLSQSFERMTPSIKAGEGSSATDCSSGKAGGASSNHLKGKTCQEPAARGPVPKAGLDEVEKLHRVNHRGGKVERLGDLEGGSAPVGSKRSVKSPRGGDTGGPQGEPQSPLSRVRQSTKSAGGATVTQKQLLQQAAADVIVRCDLGAAPDAALGSNTGSTESNGVNARGAPRSSAASALDVAVKKVVRANGMRKISFDLGRNVVCEIGSPVPPAHVRTPPSAKPHGSALKGVSLVLQPFQARLTSVMKRKRRQSA